MRGEGRPVAGALGQLVQGLPAHVVSGEHRVDDANQVHTPSFAHSAHWPIRPGAYRIGAMSSSNSDPAPSWVDRDAAVVWHGFTQMAAYADNAPLVIERAEGRELIDADGRRYLDAISSLWVNTLGHRVPELDAALAAQAGKVAHSTMLGNGNTVVVELAEALAPVVPVDDPHFLFAADGAVAVEQALKIAFQYWVNRGVEGRTRFLALGDAYHGDTVGSLSLGDGGVFSAVFDPLCFPVVRTPGYADPGWADKACATIAAHADELAAVVLEPLVQGAAGMLRRRTRRCAARRRRVPGRPACCWCATRWPPGSGGPVPCSPPNSAGCGPTCSVSARGSPAATSPCRPRWPRGGSSTRSSAPTSVRRPSTTAIPTEGTRWRPPWRSSTCASSSRGTCSPTSRPAVRSWPISWRAASALARPCVRSANAGSWWVSSWRPRERGSAGAAGSAPARWTGACCCVPSVTSSW